VSWLLRYRSPHLALLPTSKRYFDPSEVIVAVISGSENERRNRSGFEHSFKALRRDYAGAVGGLSSGDSGSQQAQTSVSWGRQASDAIRQTI